MYNVSDISRMLKLMIMHKKDNKGALAKLH